MQSQWILPAGYIEARDVLHKEVDLRPLTGREEELLTQLSRPTAALVTDVLCRCVKRIGKLDEVTPKIIRELLVGDRQYLLLMLRQLTFGDRVQATLPCPWPDCGKGVDIDFMISTIPITQCPDVQRSYQLQLEPFPEAAEMGLGPGEHITVCYRLPNGGDQEAVLDASTSGEIGALCVLLSRCILNFGEVERPSPEWVAQLPTAVRLQIEQAMEARAPNPELSMEARCPECRRVFDAPFELQDFFFGELKMGTDLLYREVHYLAFHYHWSEREIMDMPRRRRRRYIEVLADEIEKLNERMDA